MPSPSRASITQLAGTLLAGDMRLDSTALHRGREGGGGGEARPEQDVAALGAPVPGAADDDDRHVARELADPSRQLAEGDEGGPRDVPGRPLLGLADVEDEGAVVTERGSLGDGNGRGEAVGRRSHDGARRWCRRATDEGEEKGDEKGENGDDRGAGAGHHELHRC